MSNVEVKAGTCWRDDTPGHWRWDGTRIMVCDDPRPTEYVSGFDLRQILEMEANGSIWRVGSDPDPLPALLAAARKVQNLLDEVARHRIDGMDVLASALWDDVMAVASELRTALTAYEQQRQ